MQITFVTEHDDAFPVEIDPDMKLQDVMALLEAEVSHRTISPASSSFNCATRHVVRYSYIRAEHFTRRAGAQPAIGNDERPRCDKQCHAAARAKKALWQREVGSHNTVLFIPANGLYRP